MIYPRLVLARSLLRDDGVIFISIDDHEVDNLRKICDEIFGASNFITEFIWAAGRKNDSKLVSVSHEYILCYAKSRLYLHERQILWRERKQGLDEIYSAYKKIKTQFGTDYDGMTQALKEWFKSLPQTHPAKNHAHYSYVDKRGIYFPDNASWPGGGGPRYEVLHPVTQKPVKVPSRGWIFSSPQKMQEMIADDRIHFGADENSVPCTKSYLTEREYTAPYSVFYKDGRASTKRLRNLLEANVFENPKDEEIIQHIIEFIGSGNGIILDFFSGSGTTAHATLLQNAADGGKRKFIMVQLPEPCGEKTEAYKAGYKNICEIGKERICRAGDKIKSEAGDAAADLDIGFRVLKIDSSNMTHVYYAPADYSQDLVAQMEDNIKADRTDMDLLFACLIDWGLPLSLPHTRESVDGCTIHNYNDGALVACFDKNISETVIRHVAGIHPLRAVFRDNGFTSAPEKINVFELFKRLSPNTSIRVL